jgi:TrmH family RNA methyltransferase
VALTPRSARVVATRKLTRRRHRDEAGLFLAEGPQAVREALAHGSVVEVFTDGRGGDLIEAAHAAGVPVRPSTEAALAALTETVTPQGIVAVCRHLHIGLSAMVDRAPRLVAVLAGVTDPGNAGTVTRAADAAGAAGVVFGRGGVDPYNGKCVRASAGSLFHVDVVRDATATEAVEALRAAGMTVLAADAHGENDLDEIGGLAARTSWVFGSEAHGLPPEVAALATARVRVPMYGRAESLNLAAAAAVCLYASAKAVHPRSPA